MALMSSKGFSRLASAASDESRILAFTLIVASHLRNHRITELAALHFLCAFHLAGEVVRDGLGIDGAVHALEDEIGGFGPAEVAQHHFAAEDDGAGVDHVFAGVFWRGAMRGFEDGVAGDVIDVAAGGDADATNLRGECVTEVIAVEIERGDDAEVLGPREHLLERDVGNGVLDNQPRAGFALGNLAPRATVDLDRAEEVLRDIITPVAEPALGELHDVALVDNRDALALLLDGVADGGVHQPFRAEITYRLDADADLHAHHTFGRADFLQLLLPALRGFERAKTNLLKILRELFCDEIENLLRF